MASATQTPDKPDFSIHTWFHGVQDEFNAAGYFEAEFD